MNHNTRPTLKVRILVVDDEKELTDLIVRHFGFLGYDIDGVNDPRTALKKIEDEDYNIVISDIMMPGMDGLELLRRIKEYNGGIQVIMITGYVTMHNILTAMRRGAETVFFKPLPDLDKLELAVKACIGRFDMWKSILEKLAAMGKTEV